MKKFNPSLIFILFIHSFVSYSQCDNSRYQLPVFVSVTEILNVKYGEAAVWSFPYQNTDLLMDIYLPAEDDISNRPLMLWVHPGGFLTGDKTADDMVALCDSFARRGYVTATIGYRLGFNPLSVESAERAVYRGTQDMRAAIRFLKENAELYDIDTNYTFIGGSSAGGFAALHTAYLDQDEAPNSIEGGFTYPALGCLDCEGNSYSHDINLKGYTNLWGALGDSIWINPDETVPGFLVHGTADGTVPYGVGHPFGVATTPITHGSRSVSNQLESHSIMHQKYIIPNAGHEPHGTENGAFNSEPTAYWDTIFDKINTHYFEILRPETSPIIGSDEACPSDTFTYKRIIPENYKLCWDITGGNIINSSGDSVQIVFNSLGQANLTVVAYSEINAPSSVENKLITINEPPSINFSAEIQNMEVFFSPSESGFSNYSWSFGDGNSSSDIFATHTYNNPGDYAVSLVAIDQNGCKVLKDSLMDFTTLSVLKNDHLSKITLYPNPANDEINITSQDFLERIQIYSLSGKKAIDKKVLGKTFQISINNLESGIYFIKITNSSEKTEQFKLVKK